jgi:pyruvate formate lyase activating enzyme
MSEASQSAPFSGEIPASQLRVAGITPFTSIDFPGKLSAVVFVQGCPWKCLYCQNPWMQSREFTPGLEHGSWEEVTALLKRRHGLLDAVVFSGGEPCIDPALPAAVRAVKEMGFMVGLHTGGSYPRRLAEIIGMIDWVGLDVKAAPGEEQDWHRIVGVRGAESLWEESFGIIRRAGTPLECRTTVHPDYMSEESIRRIARFLREKGVDTYALQLYRNPPGLLMKKFPAIGADYPSKGLLADLKAAFPHFVLRRE